MKKNKIFLIAEAWNNHFRSSSNAIQMVKNAKQVEADIIKFQNLIPDEEMLKKVAKSSNFKIYLYLFLKNIH
jgi:sialic acid synthase SpsE